MFQVRCDFSDFEASVIVEEFNKIVKDIFRNLIFEQDIRCDGRELSELRNISCEVCRSL